MTKSKQIRHIPEVRQSEATSHLASHLAGREVRRAELRTIGERLRHIRTESRMSQKGMAAAVEVAEKTWQNYEQDKRAPDATVLKALFHLGWSPTWVLLGFEAAGEPSSGQASQELSGESFMVAFELTEEALRDRWLPKNRFFDLMKLVHDGISQGLPYAEVLDFARSAASELAKERKEDGGKQGVGGSGSGGAGGGSAPLPGQGEW